MEKNYNINIDELKESEKSLKVQMAIFSNKETLKVYSYNIIGTALLSYIKKSKEKTSNYKLDKLIIYLLSHVNVYNEIKIDNETLKKVAKTIEKNKISDELFTLLLLKYNTNLKLKRIRYKIDTANSHERKKLLEKEQQHLLMFLEKTNNFISSYNDSDILYDNGVSNKNKNL